MMDLLKDDIMEEKYKSDTPVSERENDKFQRYTFSKRIAETIAQRKTAESIVIGIYGDWGEGKTSVLNFIDENLSSNQEIVVCKFNPWRFQDENQLLAGFFSLLASQLKKSLQSKVEKVGELIGEYAEIFIPDFSLAGGFNIKAGEFAKKIGQKISVVDIAEQKKRIENFLKEHKKRIVIFIDDIDRLDKKEIQAIFRLVKLTADFSYTSYILAFDEKMVAKAIGEIYEDGGEKAGKNFLEKIIQVPLRLPLAPKEALKDFCFKQVESAIESNNINFSPDDASRFNRNFSNYIIPKLTTPRMAVRYGNAIAFSMPLLENEVNAVDLMLVEAIKIFYPELYDFIRSNSHFFIGSYSSRFATREVANNERKKKCREEITRVLSAIHVEEDSIRELLIELFPVLKEVYNNYSHTENSFAKWHKQKRIGSSQYFQRYFSYTVIKGEISDVKFDEYLDKISKSDLKKNIELTVQLLEGIDPSTLFFKCHFVKDNMPIEKRKILAFTLSQMGDKFPTSNSIFSIDSANGKIAYLIYKIVEDIENKLERYEFVKELIGISKPLDFTLEIMHSFRNDRDKENQENKTLSNDEFDKISLMVLDRALNDAGETPIFEMFANNSYFLLRHTWKSLRGDESLMNYIRKFLDENPKKLALLIKSYTPITQSSNHNGRYQGDLTKDVFNSLKESFDIEYLHKVAIQLVDNEVAITQYVELDYNQTDDNLISQFIYLYNQAINEA